MKKILFLIALFTLMGGVNSVKARTNINMSTATASTNATWTSATNTFVWTAENEYVVIPGLSGDLTGCYLDLTISDACRIDLVFTDDTERKGDWNGYGRFGSSGSKTQDLGIMAGEKINQVKEVRIASTSASGSITITAVSYYYPVRLEFDALGKTSISKDYLTATGGLTYDPSTGVLTSNGTAGTMVVEFATPVDLSYLVHYEVKRSGTDDIISRLKYYDKDNALINTWSSIKLDNNWQMPGGIDNSATNAFLNHNPVKKMVWESDANASNKDKTLTITSVNIDLKTISSEKVGVAQLNTLAWNRVYASGTDTPNWNMNGTSDTYYGDYSGNATHYADLTDYSELRVYCKDNKTGFRCFFIKSDYEASDTPDTGNNTTMYNESHASVTWNAEGGYYSMDLSMIAKWDGKVALKSIKAENGGSKLEKFVSNILVYNTPAANAPQYILTGSGYKLAETVAALADATATCIDATAVTGITTDSEAGRTLLTSANSNCLFLGSIGNGHLSASTKNVVNGDACTNLELTDGNYPFKAPSTFTASSVSYNRTFTVGKASTVCLPFELSKEEAHAAGTFYTLTAYEGGTLTFTEIGEDDGTEAYKPYLFKAASGTPFSSAYANKEIAETPATLTGTTVEGYTLTGVLTGSTDVAADNEGKTVYGWSANSGEEGTFVKVGEGVSIDPFRAYVVYNGGSGLARMAARFIGGSVTGINEVSEAQGFMNFEGKVFENGKIVIYKKGMKFNANGARLK